jgi:hypothetical protein
MQRIRTEFLSVGTVCFCIVSVIVVFLLASPGIGGSHDMVVEEETHLRDALSHKAFTWGNDVTIVEGQVEGGISIASDTSGNLYAVRCSTDVSTTLIIYKSTDAGETWFHLTQTGAPSGSLLHPVLLTGSNGDKLYLFNLYSSLNGIIRLLRYHQENGAWDGNWEVKVDSDTITYFSACTDMGKGDHLMVAFQRERMGYLTPDIYTTVSTDQGETWSDGYYLTGDGSHPDIAYGNDGYVYLVYEKYLGGPDQEIGFIRSDNYGAPASWDDRQYLTSDSYDDTYPKVAGLHHALPDDAHVWVAYNHDWGNGNIDLYYAHSSDGGLNWSKDQPLANSTDYDEMACDLWAKPDETYNWMSVCYLKHKLVLFSSVEEYSEVHRAYVSRSFPTIWYSGGQVSDSTAAKSEDGREVCQGAYTRNQVCAIYAGKTSSGNFENLYFDNGSWVDVEEQSEEEELMPRFSLCHNYPNPFNPVTRIQYTVNSRQTPLRTTLEIYNIRGQLVRALVDEPKQAGTYEVTWDGRDEVGNEVASGVYLYQLQAEDFSQTKKMLLLK